LFEMKKVSFFVVVGALDLIDLPKREKKTQKPLTVFSVVALGADPPHQPLGHLQVDPALLNQPPARLGQLQSGDLSRVGGLEVAEDDDLVEPVEQLGPEVPLELLEHERADAAVGAVLGRLAVHAAQVEADPAAPALADDRGADVGRHDQEHVFEGDGAALGVGEAAVLEDLQEHVEHVRVRLLDLVEEDDAVGLAADGLGELASFSVADVAVESVFCC
jgi:hypothetical protein